MIKVKHIQISKNGTFNDLENKLQRIFKHTLKLENLNHDFKIYKHQRSSSELFELLLAYLNKNKSYKIIVKELKKSENSSKTLSDLKIGNKDTIIVEVLTKNMIVKPFIRVGSETLTCSLCNSKIDSSSALKCDNCSQNIYCSQKCKSNDLVHSEYHKKISGLYKKKLTLEEIKEVNINSFLDTNSKGGLVCIKNLGNTSFLSASVHS